ncbi:serine/threonine-protein kinase Nek11-like isoform X3 [Mytilus californianus]|uniref:serine/threonine-protein kinase Nek11-like isoform X3 n=1 Tax=Mytilus californianus TaxID=6549 RepID=UPI0022479D3E|nr:serine/threonine-protein kinase Nek11-like isoform X3 [Mytilus californianus]
MSFKQNNTKEKKKARIYCNRYETIKRLGKGNFGTAFLVRDRRLKTRVAEGESDLKVLKEISVGELAPDETVDAVSEAKVLSKLNHPGIVKFHDSFIDGESFCIVTEYCEGGDLDAKINELAKSKKNLEEKTILDWFVQLVLAVHYMHTRRILHRDLKSRNIFLKGNMVKIGDFGISKILMGTADLASTFTGTPYYMSPEVLKHEGYNSKSDVWSIGCILYEMCTLCHAFDGKSLMAVMYKIVEGEPPKLPDTYSSEISRVLNIMLQRDPEKRPSATDLLKEPLLANHIAKMSQDYQSRHTDHATKDAEEIAKLLKQKSRLRDLQEKEEDQKWKNLPPRERMRIRKQQQADQEAERLRESAKLQLSENIQRKNQIQKTLHMQSVPAWAGGSGEGEKFREALTVVREDDKTIKPNKSKDFGTRSAPCIPDNPELADTYYSQYEDFDKSSSDDEMETVVHRNSEQGTIVPNSVSTSVGEEGQFYELLKDVLDKGDDAESTMTFQDDHDAGAFGPVVREQKIKNLRAECQKYLGEEAFEKAYTYLKKARYEKQNSLDSAEEDIMQGLRKFVKNPSDCFLVDQLLFLEEQAKISKG